MYAGAQRFGLGDGGTNSTSLPPITSISPSPVPAGPGQQIVVVRGAGMADGDNLAISPVDYGAITNPTTQGYGAPLFAVSGDGTTAKALIDLRGNVAAWTAQIISPYTFQQSPEFRFDSVAGSVGALNLNDYALQSGQLVPVIVVADTQLVTSQDSQGRATNHVVVTGGDADVPQMGGGSINQKFPGPGLLLNQSGGTWQFVPAAQAAAIFIQRFGNVIPQCAGSAIGQDLTDPFGLPIVTPQCPGSLSWVDTNGNPVTSPWSTGAAPAPGSPIVTVRPTAPTPVPASGPTPVLYQSPATPPPTPGTSTAPALPTPPPATMYQPPVTVPASSTPTPASTSTDLYQSPDANGTVAAPAPAAAAAAPASSGLGLGALLLILGGLGYAMSTHKGRGSQTWR